MAQHRVDSLIQADTDMSFRRQKMFCFGGDTPPPRGMLGMAERSHHAEAAAAAGGVCRALLGPSWAACAKKRAKYSFVRQSSAPVLQFAPTVDMY